MISANKVGDALFSFQPPINMLALLVLYVPLSGSKAHTPGGPLVSSFPLDLSTEFTSS
jgi:hypothetical protein